MVNSVMTRKVVNFARVVMRRSRLGSARGGCCVTGGSMEPLAYMLAKRLLIRRS